MKTLLFLIALSLSVSAQRPDRRGGESAPKPGEAIPEVSVVTLKGKKRSKQDLNARVGDVMTSEDLQHLLKTTAMDTEDSLGSRCSLSQ